MYEEEEENQQRLKELEAALLQLNETLTKAEKLEGQTITLQLLSGDLQHTNVKFDEPQLRQQLSLRIIKAQEEERLRVARKFMMDRPVHGYRCCGLKYVKINGIGAGKLKRNCMI